MIKCKNIFLFLFLNLLFINFSSAENKVAYIDIDRILSNSQAGKLLLEQLKKEEELTINKFRTKDESFKSEEKKILEKKNLIAKEELKKELKLLQNKFTKYMTGKDKEIKELKNRRDKNIIKFLNLINPIIEKFMEDNSIYMILDKKNVFIAKIDYDITDKLIELINNEIKTIEIE